MDENLRKSGINIIGDISWGTHFCQFYQTKNDLLEILIHYFKAGLENNEFCFWATPYLTTVEEAKEDLRKAIPDFDAYLKKGQIEFISNTDLYLKEGIFDSQKIFDFLVEKINYALANGYKGLRLTEAALLLEEYFDYFLDYEEKLNSIIGEYPVIALCTYSLEMCIITDAIEIASSHDFSVSKKKGKWKRTESSRQKSIAKYKRTEKGFQGASTRLRKSKEWLQFIVDNSPDNIFLQDSELHYVWVSKPIEGLSIDQYIGRTDIELGNLTEMSESRREVHAIKQQILESGIGRTLEVTLNAPTGPQYFISTYEPWRDKEGQVIGLAGYVHDITEVKKAQNTAERERARLQTIIENIPVAVGETDANGGVLLDNGMLDSIWKGEQKIGSVSDYKEFKAWWPETGERVKPEEWPAARALKGEASTATFNIEKFDGTKGTIIVSAKPIMNENGEVTSTIWINQDITELKQAEEALREAHEELQVQSEELQVSYEELQAQSEEIQTQTEELEEAYETMSESEKQYRLLFTNMSEGFALTEIIYNEEGKPIDYRYIEINPAHELYFGINREEIIGKTVLEVFPNMVSIAAEKFREVAVSGQSTHFEVYSQAANKYIEFYVFRPEKGKLAVIFRDITDRKKVEEALKASEEQYRAFFENSMDAILLTSPDGTIYAANPAAQRIFGMTEEEIIRAGRTGIVDLSDPRLKSALEERERTGKFRGELNYKRKDGTIFPGEVSTAYFKDKNDLAKTAMIIRDITERKLSEEVLREIEASRKVAEAIKIERQRLFDVLDTLPVMICLITPDHHYAFTNRKFREKFGECGDRHCYECCFEFSKPCEFCEAFKVLETGKPHYWEVTTPDGSIIDVHNFPFTDVDGSQLILEMDTDITESRKAKEKLQESEKKYRNIIETANEGVVVIDSKFKATYVNRKMEELLGYSQEEIIGKSALDFTDEEGKAIANLKRKRILQDIDETLEFKFIRKDGSPLWTLVNSKSIFDKDGNFTGALNMYTDITKRKEAELALERIGIARQKEIHHRIKNNLQVISSLLDLQAEKFSGKENVNCSEVLKAFKESQNRVMSIALIHREFHESKYTDKLNFSIYLQRLADNLFQTYRLEGTNVSLSLNLEENIFFDMDIAVPLGMIVNEIISNSFKYAFPDRNKGEIQINLHKGNKKDENTEYVLTVSDNGIGIPENINFENPDTLGLQLVNILVEQIDGCIKLKRKHGTEFTIVFSNRAYPKTLN